MRLLLFPRTRLQHLDAAIRQRRWALIGRGIGTRPPSHISVGREGRPANFPLPRAGRRDVDGHPAGPGARERENIVGVVKEGRGPSLPGFGAGSRSMPLFSGREPPRERGFRTGLDFAPSGRSSAGRGASGRRDASASRDADVNAFAQALRDLRERGNRGVGGSRLYSRDGNARNP